MSFPRGSGPGTGSDRSPIRYRASSGLTSSASLEYRRVTVLATVRRTDRREHCLGHRDQAWARPELEEGSPVYPARVVLDRQAPAPSDQSAGSCRGLDLVASCRQSNMNLLELVSGMSYDR